MTTLASVWVATYAILGLWASAAIPFAYQVASTASIVTFARTRRYLLFRTSRLWLPLLLPFALQWSLGGFERSSGVSMWAFASPVGALLFLGARQALPWFGGFMGLIALSAAIDPALSDHAPDLPNGVVIAFFALNILGITTTAYALLQYFVRARDLALAQSERLLLNVLPEPVAERLKAQDGIIADACPEVTVLFADIVGFTPLSARLSAPELVTVLDHVFAEWDALAAKHGVEKIKTIGDAYMVAAGVPLQRDDHIEAIADMALAMQPVLARYVAESGLALQVRLGIETGPVVAGVIGRVKFIYDLWGDTVNTASRMESHAPTGAIQVTERVYAHLRDRYELEPRGTIEVKGKGPMTTYSLLARRPRENTSTRRVLPALAEIDAPGYDFPISYDARAPAAPPPSISTAGPRPLPCVRAHAARLLAREWLRGPRAALHFRGARHRRIRPAPRLTRAASPRAHQLPRSRHIAGRRQAQICLVARPGSPAQRV